MVVSSNKNSKVICRDCIIVSTNTIILCITSLLLLWMNYMIVLYVSYVVDGLYGSII